MNKQTRGKEELRASARGFFRIQHGEDSLVRRNRKPSYRKFAWIFGTSATVIALLYWEQVGVLFVLSTLAMCALLLVVAFSNLEARDKELHQAALQKTDAADQTQSASAKKKVA